MMRFVRCAAPALALSVSLFFVACGGGDDRDQTPGPSATATPAVAARYEPASEGLAAQVDIRAAGRRFEPAELTVDGNTTVTIKFANDSDETHTLTVYLGEDVAGTVIAGTGEVAAASTGETSVLLAPGRHAFRCEIHPEMEGTISVE